MQSFSNDENVGRFDIKFTDKGISTKEGIQFSLKNVLRGDLVTFSHSDLVIGLGSLTYACEDYVELAVYNKSGGMGLYEISGASVISVLHGLPMGYLGTKEVFIIITNSSSIELKKGVFSVDVDTGKFSFKSTQGNISYPVARSTIVKLNLEDAILELKSKYTNLAISYMTANYECTQELVEPYLDSFIDSVFSNGNWGDLDRGNLLYPHMAIYKNCEGLAKSLDLQLKNPCKSISLADVECNEIPLGDLQPCLLGQDLLPNKPEPLKRISMNPAVNVYDYNGYLYTKDFVYYIPFKEYYGGFYLGGVVTVRDWHSDQRVVFYVTQHCIKGVKIDDFKIREDNNFIVDLVSSCFDGGIKKDVLNPVLFTNLEHALNYFVVLQNPGLLQALLTDSDSVVFDERENSFIIKPGKYVIGKRGLFNGSIKDSGMREINNWSLAFDVARLDVMYKEFQALQTSLKSFLGTMKLYSPSGITGLERGLNRLSTLEGILGITEDDVATLYKDDGAVAVRKFIDSITNFLEDLKKDLGTTRGMDKSFVNSLDTLSVGIKERFVSNKPVSCIRGSLADGAKGINDREVVLAGCKSFIDNALEEFIFDLNLDNRDGYIESFGKLDEIVNDKDYASNFHECVFSKESKNLDVSGYISEGGICISKCEQLRLWNTFSSRTRCRVNIPSQLVEQSKQVHIKKGDPGYDTDPIINFFKTHEGSKEYELKVGDKVRVKSGYTPIDYNRNRGEYADFSGMVGVVETIRQYEGSSIITVDFNGRSVICSGITVELVELAEGYIQAKSEYTHQEYEDIEGIILQDQNKPTDIEFFII